MTVRFVDAHLDLAYLAVNGRDLTASPPPGGCVTLPALADGGVKVICATIYTAPGGDGPEGYPDSADRDAAHAAGRRQLEVYEKLEADGHVRLVRTQADLASAASDDDPRPGLILLMEGADPIRTPDEVAWWRDRGLALVGLTWALGTRYAGGNSGGGPLTAEGRDLIAALDAHGIGHDVSHLSRQAFDDVMACAMGPVVASHSNCQVIAGAKERHLDDDQIRELGARDGIVGLNLYAHFLRPGADRPTVSDAIDHVAHVAEIMNRRDGVGLGSDMDGGFGPEWLPADLTSPAHLPRLDDELAARGWSDAERDGFCRDNWLKQLRRMLPAARNGV